MRRPSAVLTVLALAAAAAVSLAAPASADHFVGVSRLGCDAGAGTGFPGDVRTARVRVQAERAGSIRTSCHFSGLPETYYVSEYVYLWQRPTRSTRTGFVPCELAAAGGVTRYGEGTLLITPAGTARVDCTFPVQG